MPKSVTPDVTPGYSRLGYDVDVPKRPKGKRVSGADGSFTVSGKAANGEGSLYREADGGWRATYRVPGESRPRRVRGRTREEGLHRRGEASTRALAEGPRSTTTTTLSASSTIAEFAAWWLNTVAAVRVRPSSLGKYVDRVERIAAWLGDVRIGSVRAEQVATWQSELLSSLSAKTVADTRATFRSVMGEAVNLGLIPTNPVDRVRPPKILESARRALTAAEARAVVAAGADDRFGAAIALLFVQGWRVSEVLGLAWSDLDLDAGVATVSRASVYADGIGMMLGPPKTEGAKGRHLLTPAVVELLGRRQQAQDEERQHAGDTWQQLVYEGRPIDLVFTTTTGGLSCARPSPRRSPPRPQPSALIQQGSAPTPDGRRRSPYSTRKRDSTWPTLPATSVTQRQRQRPVTFDTSAGGQARQRQRRVGCSTRRASNATRPNPKPNPEPHD